MPSIGVVVLNYNDYESTIQCVKSLLSCDPAPLRIIVVDNDSPNESLQKLQTHLGKVEYVDVVSSGRNGGYSFGNNVGIRALRELGFRHVLIATPDTEVRTKALFSLLESAIDSKAGVVAPQIESDGAVDNPSVERLTARYLFDLWWVRAGMPLNSLRTRLRYLLGRYLPGTRKALSARAHVSEDGGPPRHVYKLHGAFLCLTELFLDRVGELDEALFMFGEEDLLSWLCFKNGLSQVLVPEARVHHAHDSSVNLTWGHSAKSFVDEQQSKSARVLREKIPMWPLFTTWRKGTGGLPTRAHADD